MKKNQLDVDGYPDGLWEFGSLGFYLYIYNYETKKIYSN
jgi:hypothetical protein